jgi:syntaxin 18
MTDQQREELDLQAKTMLRELNSGIFILHDKEAKRRDDEGRRIRKKYGGGLGALGSWAAGGKKTEEHEAAEERAKCIEEHHEAVIWFLRKHLQSCASTQQHMMEVRLKREMEKSRSVLANATTPLAMPAMPAMPAPPSTADRQPQARENGQRLDAARSVSENLSGGHEELTAEQVQMFEKGNQDMMSHYQERLEQVKYVAMSVLSRHAASADFGVRTAEQSVLEIMEMQAQIGSHLDVQQSHVDQLVSDSFDTVDNVGGGNKQLRRALEKPSAAKYTFYAAGGLCIFLVLWDLII